MRHGGHFFRILLTAVLLLGLLPLNIWAAEGQSAGEATVLFTHDLHSCFYPRVQEGGEERGGFARLAAALTEERTGHPDALTVDAGDFSSGSLVQTLSTTRAPELVTLGAMGYDAVTAGNHEFDNGPLGFGEMLTAAGRGGGALPALVMANYRPAEDDPNRLDLQRAMAAYGVQEYLLLERGGVTYGIFGLMGQDAHASAPTSSFVLEDPAQAAQRCVSRLEEQGAEFIICLSHSGTSQTSASEDEDLARAVPEIDLIVSGHTHTTLPEPIVVGDTYIVSAGSNCENLGSITLSWNGAGEKTLEEYRLIPIDGTAGEDPEISALARDWKEQVDIGYLGSYGLTYDQVLTRSDFFLPLPQAGVQDGNALGELTADSFAWAARTIAGLPEGEPLIALTADGVLRALEQRDSTLRRCAQCIADWQREFFREGPQMLRPMRLSDVARELGLHESTISRAVREKYLQCSRGVYPMSYFFSRSATAQTDGAEVGAAAAKALLCRLVEREDKGRPLSDQKLCEAMAELGCPISRRTVAKYREELNIPSASGRKWN